VVAQFTVGPSEAIASPAVLNAMMDLSTESVVPTSIAIPPPNTLPRLRTSVLRLSEGVEHPVIAIAPP
jgi:hypothetical protein